MCEPEEKVEELPVVKLFSTTGEAPNVGDRFNVFAPKAVTGAPVSLDHKNYAWIAIGKVETTDLSEKYQGHAMVAGEPKAESVSRGYCRVVVEDVYPPNEQEVIE